MSANPEQYLGNKFYDEVVGSHREWLGRHGDQYRDTWDQLFVKDNTEAALCEAATRQMFNELGIDVYPLSCEGDGRTPDFRCVKDGEEFYVDATCVMKDTATRKSRLAHVPENHEASSYGLLTDSFFKKVDNKVSQFKDLCKPCVVVIGTLHFSAGQLCFNNCAAEEILTGGFQITGAINTVTGEPVGETYQSTTLKATPFLEPRRIISDEPVVRAIRQGISAVLLCPFGTHPVEVLGVLHPEPYQRFKRELLERIRFCCLEEGWQNGQLNVKWV